MASPSRKLVDALRSHPVKVFATGLAVLLAVIFFDPLFVRKTFVGRDLMAFFFPIEKAIHDAWRSGHLPLLIPEISFGRPLAANPNSGAFYPLRIAMAALPFPVAFKLFPLVHIWLAGMGAFLLSRFLGASGWGSTLTGLVFALCGPALSEIMYTDFLPGLALLPFVILLAGRLARERTSRNAAVFGLALGFQILVGDVFTAGVALLGCVLLAICEAAPRSLLRAIGAFGAASIPGLLIGMVQVIPAILLVPHTVRALGRLPLGIALAWSVSPWRLLELLVRLPFGNAAHGNVVWGYALWSGKSAGFFNTLYAGVAGGLAIVAFRPARRRRLFFYGLGFGCLFLAGIGFFCPPAWSSITAPIPLRYPEKFMAGFALVLALLAGHALDEILMGRSNRYSKFAAGIAIALGLSILAVKEFPLGTERFIISHWATYPKAAVAGAQNLPGILFRSALLWTAAAGVLAAASRLRNRDAAAALLLLFFGTDLAGNRALFITTKDENAVFAPPTAANAVREVNMGEWFGYLPIEDYFPPEKEREPLLTDYAAPFHVFYSFNQDYDASDLYRVEIGRRQLAEQGGQWRGFGGYLSAFSVRSAILDTGKMPTGFLRPGPTLGSKWVVVNPLALPLIRYAGAVREVESPVDAYAAIHDEQLDLSAVTVVESGRRAAYRLGQGTLRVLESRAGKLTIESSVDAPARVIIPRAFFPYRDFSLDGRRVEAQATNFCLSSVAVPPGSHILTVTEELPGGASAPSLTLAGVLVVLILWMRGGAGVRSA